MLVDSTVFIDYLRGEKKAKIFIENQTETYTTSVVVVMEIVAGMKDKIQIDKFLLFLQRFDISFLHISSSISATALEIYLKMRFKGVGIADSLIAATAINQQDSLATHNRKHFAAIPKLKVILPY